MTDSVRADGTDGFFGFVVGLYAAAVVAPAVTVVVAASTTTAPGALFAALLGTAAVVAGIAGWFGRRRSVAVRLGATRWVWAAMGIPLAYFGVLFAADPTRGAVLPEPVAWVALIGALAGLFTGLGLVTAAHNRHAKAVLADAPPEVEFAARAPERDRTLAKRAAGGLVAVGALGSAAEVLLAFDWFEWLTGMFVGLAASLAGMTNRRETRVSAAGLVAGTPTHERLLPWSAFESYDVTDDAIVVRRAGWSAWGLRDVRRDPADVDDPEAVADALGEFLPRR